MAIFSPRLRCHYGRKVDGVDGQWCHAVILQTTNLLFLSLNSFIACNVLFFLAFSDMEEPPEVLKPGKLGLGGPRPERIDGMLTSPCSLGPMHGFTWGKTADARVVNFNGQTSWRITPRLFFLFLSLCFLQIYSRFHVSGSVGSFICDVVFRHGDQRFVLKLS